MQGLKGIVVIATIVASVVALGACRCDERVVEPMKLGAADVVSVR